jgi:hypothetical protein
MILNNKIFVPLFGISSDADALATYEAAMPGYEVFGCTGSWYSDDAIHCRTMEIHDRYMLVVDTNPLQDREYNTGDYRVTAYIDDQSETGLVNDSLLVYWRLEGSPGFSAVVMQTKAHPDSYYADIPMQADSVNIEYYVFAKDNSYRRSTRPPVAPNAWYTFMTGGEDLSGIAGRQDRSNREAPVLAQNSPNPFSRMTEIRYDVPVACWVNLSVYDVRGRHMVTLVDEHQTAGYSIVGWDGRAENGAELPDGVYFYTLRAGHHAKTRKMLLVN